MSEQTERKTGPGRVDGGNSEPASLDHRYGKIGIPAVAAALRYASTRPPRPSATGVRIEDRFIELAA
jgi:hypothetical protein